MVLVFEVICSLLGSHLDYSEHVIMTVPCRLIHSLKVAINKKICSYAELKYQPKGTDFIRTFRVYITKQVVYKFL